jgi:hypothetical protein
LLDAGHCQFDKASERREARRSRVRERLDLAEGRPESIPCDLDVVAVLDVQPETLAGPEVWREPQRRVGRDAPLAVDDLGDSSRWNADGPRQAVPGDLKRLQVLEHQNLAGVNGGQSGGVERAEAEAFYDAGREAVVEVLLAMDRRIQQLETRVEKLERELTKSSSNS